MNPTQDELALTRWLDGDMNATERAAFEAQLAADPALQAEAHALQQLSGQLQAAFPRIAEVPHPDFFNSQIQDRIALLGRQDAPREAEAAGSWFGWLRLPWLFGATAAMLALLAVFGPSKPKASTAVLSMYAPNATIQPHTYHSDEAAATVLVLDGLESIPAEQDVIAHHVDHSHTDPQVAMTKLYSAEGKVLMVLDIDGRSQPRVVAQQ